MKSLGAAERHERSLIHITAHMSARGHPQPGLTCLGYALEGGFQLLSGTNQFPAGGSVVTPKMTRAGQPQLSYCIEDRLEGRLEIIRQGRQRHRFKAAICKLHHLACPGEDQPPVRIFHDRFHHEALPAVRRAVFVPGDLIEGKEPPLERGCPELAGRIGKDFVALGNRWKAGRRLSGKGDRSHAIEAHEAIIGRQPYIAVAGLRNGAHGGRQQAIGCFPNAQEEVSLEPLRILIHGTHVLAAARAHGEAHGTKKRQGPGRSKRALSHNRQKFTQNYDSRLGRSRISPALKRCGFFCKFWPQGKSSLPVVHERYPNTEGKHLFYNRSGCIAFDSLRPPPRLRLTWPTIPFPLSSPRSRARAN